MSAITRKPFNKNIAKENLTDIKQFIKRSAFSMKQNLAQKLLIEQPAGLSKEIILRHAAHEMLSTLKP